ncbi:MAG: class I SAM-dependent methyltransferase [Hyphomicrobiaceae bacterium]
MRGKARANVGWLDYWNGNATIYVNDRHKCVHYEDVARDIVRLLPGPGARVVDYGCGEALSAAVVADACAHLYLSDGAPVVREGLAARFAGRANIAIIDPRQFEQLAPHTIDLIVVNSLVQYLSASEFAHLIAVARHKLSAAGRLVLADIVPRHVSPVRDAAEFLKFAGANGFLVPAGFGLVRSYLSGYREIRAKYGFLQFDEPEMLALLTQAGFAAHRHYPNMGHNTQRMAFVATRAARD